MPPTLDEAIGLAVTVSPAEWCQLFFVFLSTGVLAVAATPAPIRSLLINYGARLSGPDNGRDAGDDWLVRLVRAVTSWGQVPHAWFSAFYVVSVGCSVFWLAQYAFGWSLLRLIASWQAEFPAPSMSLQQVVVAWFLVFAQGSRRIYEHLTFIKPSNSRIWVVHWLLGLAFYLCLSVSVWVEGSRAILHGSWQPYDSLALQLSSVKLLLAIAVYFVAWREQYRCHRYLSGLKKYSLPEQGLFQHILCPHYTWECLLYLSLAVAAAPDGRLCNRTLLCAVLFALLNLGVTANGTRRWYVAKFGEDKVAGRWRMIPLLF